MYFKEKPAVKGPKQVEASIFQHHRFIFIFFHFVLSSTSLNNWVVVFFLFTCRVLKIQKREKKGNAHIKGSPAPSLRQVPTNQPTESLLKRDFFFFPQRSTTEGTCPTLSAPGPTLVGRVRCRPTSRAFQSSPDLILKAWQLCRISQQLCWKDCGGTIYLAGTQLPKHYTTLLTKHLDDKRFA